MLRKMCHEVLVNEQETSWTDLSPVTPEKGPCSLLGFGLILQPQHNSSHTQLVDFNAHFLLEVGSKS